MKQVLLVLLCSAALAGCGGLRSNRPVEQVYVLHAAPAAIAPNTGQAIAGVLRVPRPDVQPGLDSSRIALARASNELDHFADSRWGESLPKVLGAFAVESLAHSGLFETVVSVESTSVPRGISRRCMAPVCRRRAWHLIACCWVGRHGGCWDAVMPKPKSPPMRIDLARSLVRCRVRRKRPCPLQVSARQHWRDPSKSR
jgi:hypothetical protein